MTAGQGRNIGSFDSHWLPRPSNNTPKAFPSHSGPFREKSEKSGPAPPRVPLIFTHLGLPVAPPRTAPALPRDSLPGDVLKTLFGPLRVLIRPKTMFLEGPVVLETQGFGDPGNPGFWSQEFFGDFRFVF